MCEHLCLCIYVAFPGPFLCLFPSLVFLSYSDLFVCSLLFYFYSPSDSLFPKERQKDVDSEGRGNGEKLREVGGLETITRKYCMKKNYFQRKKNKGKMGFLRQEEA